MNAPLNMKPRVRVQANDRTGATARLMSNVAPVPRMLAFDAGKNGRRLRAVPTTTEAINRLIRTYGKSVLGRSRYLCANNPYAAAAKEAFVNALVGSGIKPSPLFIQKKKRDIEQKRKEEERQQIENGEEPEKEVAPEEEETEEESEGKKPPFIPGQQQKPEPEDDPELEAIALEKEEIVTAWRDWTDEADADGLTDFYGIQVLAAGEMFEAGECFIRLRARRIEDDLTVPLQLQLLQSEMLDLSFNRSVTAGSNRIECGIEFDRLGKRVAYHFFTNPPGNDIFMRDPSLPMRTRVPAAEVLHLYKPQQAGQIRGIPHTISAITKCAIFDAYEDAELERKRTAALFSGFVTRPARDDSSFPLENPTDPYASIPTQGNAFGLEPGAMIDLAEGEEVQFSTPADVGTTYEPFMYRQLLGISSGFGVPYMHMTGDQRQSSYGTQRAAELMFRRRIEAMQHQVMVFQFCRPIWNRWILDAVLSQAVPIDIVEFNSDPKLYYRVKWIPPKWDWIDPLKDRQAEKLAVDNGWKSRDDVIEAEGYDPEEVDNRIAASQERAERLGIDIEGPKEQTSFPPMDQNGFIKEGEGDEAPPDETDEQKAQPPSPRRKGFPSRPPAKAKSASAGDTGGGSAGDGDAQRPIVLHNHQPSVHVDVHLPAGKGHRTKVLATDSNGRILETESVPIEDEA